MKKNIFLICIVLFAALLNVKVWGQSIIVQTGSLNLCPGGSVTLKADNTITPTPTYQWQTSTDGGNTWNSIGGQTNQTYTTNTAGLYTVLVNGTQYAPVTVTTNPNPVANFSFTPNTNICSGTAVAFTPTVTVGTAPFTYSWNFGDATPIDNSANPSHTFTALGCGSTSFTVSLTVTDANGCSVTISNTVNVLRAPDVLIKDLAHPFSEYSNCGNSPSPSNPNFTVNLGNSSPSSGCITNYSVNWGDGSSASNISFPLSHTYTQLGAFDLVITAMGTNGCVTVKYYKVVNQSNPAVGISGPGGTTGCTPSGFWFKLTQYSLNSPGTYYVWNFGDGTPDTIWNMPITVDSIFHVFNTSSCGKTGNQFTVKVTAKNGCDSTSATVNNIKLFKKPVSNFTYPTSICVGQNATFTNTTVASYNQGDCNRNTIYDWNFGDGTSNSSSTSPTHSYSIPGNYTVTLISSGSCGNDTITKTICVVPTPVPSFTIDNNSGCIPLTVNATNTSNTLTSCVPATYAWSVTYTSANCGTSSSFSFTNGTNASSISPSFIFNNPGTYTIRLTITNACGTFFTTKTVEVKKPPTVSLPNYANGCGSVTINPSTGAIISACSSGSLTYAWTFTGGTPATSNSANPGNVVFSNSGTNTVSLTVTNECGSTTTSKSFNLSPTPDVTVPANQTFCAGASTGALSFSSSISGTTFNWTNSNTAIGLAASGTGNINSFTATNNTANPITATITVTPVNGCNGAPQTFAITVNPKPVIPAQSATICSNTSFTITPANGGSTIVPSGTTYTWGTPVSNPAGAITGGSAQATGVSSISQTLTNTSSSVATLTYTVTPTSGTCAGNNFQVVVTVNSAAGISDQTAIVCSGTAFSVTPSGAPSGTTYTWTAPVSNPVGAITGGSAQSTNVSVISQTLTNTTNAPATLTYTVTPTAGGCGNGTFLVTVTVNAKPLISNQTVSSCSGVAFTNSPTDNAPTIIVPAGTTYSWSTPTVTGGLTGGAAGTAQSSISGTLNNPTNINQTATYNITATSGAGGNCTSSFTLTATINPKPVIGNQTRTVCTGTAFTVTPTNSAPTTIVPAGTTYSWSAPVVTGGMTGGTAGSNQTSISGTLINATATPQTATYTVTPVSGATGNCAGNSFDVVVTVNPKPVLTATPSSVTICSGQSLTVNLSSSVNNSTFTWSSTANGNISGNTNQLTPTTANSFTHTLSTTSTTDVTLTYTINVTGPASTNCTGDAVTLIVTVKPSATVANAGTDQRLCAATTATLAGNNPVVGTGVWTQIAGPAVTIANANSFNTGLSGLLPDNTYRFVWSIAGLGACPGTTDTVDIINRPAITAANAGNDGTVCNFSTTNNTFTLSGNADASRPYETGTWSFVTAANGATINNVNNPAATITFTQPGTYELKWTITNGGACTPSSDNVIINVYATPVAGNLSASSTSICKGNSVTITNQSVTGQVQLWQFKRPYTQTTWTDTLVTGASITFNNVTDTFLVRSKVVSSGAPICTTEVFTTAVQINVAPPTIAGTTSADKTECKGSNSGTITLSGYTGTIVRWESSVNNGVSWSTITNTTTTQSYLNLNQTTLYRAVVKSGTCAEAFSTVTTITIVNPVTAPNAGADVKLCNANTVTLLGNTPASNETGTWSLVVGNPVSFSSSNTPSTTITGLQVGSYTFQWTINNNVCPPQSDQVDVIVYPSITNTIATAQQTVCATQAVTVTGDLPTGGNAPYSYIWQQSTDNTNWTNIVPSQTGQSLTFTPTSSIYVRRIVNASPCTSNSLSAYIIVQPAITNNSLSANQSICINTAAAAIIGSTPSGGNGNFAYQWQQSINNGVTWTNIASATAKDYSPGILNQTTQYRRIVSTDLCTGTQGNISSAVVVTVNPDAKALFTYLRDNDCAPFNINSSIIQPSILPAQNGSYNWYANNNSIGNGTTFPGYVLTNPGDSVTIKLVAISQFGCKNDSMVHKFYTVPKPATAFTLSDTVGCGPLLVSFVNTTPNINWFTYQWNFGNGVTSTAIQPANVSFATNPTYNDTVYTVTLKAITSCESVSFTKTIRVKSKPKAIFTPNKSVGCSPLTVTFSNISKGARVSYIWNFGDGTIVTAATNVAQTHTFYAGVQDTFTVKLIAINDCGNDTAAYKIVVSPNQVHLDFAINGNQSQGCKPHSVSFINASSGATNFQWNFGDGNTLSTVKNIDTVNHTFLQSGTYIVTLYATNGCSDTTSTETIQVFNPPVANFTASPFTACIGDTIRFFNQSDSATSLLWNFRDGYTSTLTNPPHAFAAAGVYNVQLKAIRQYNSGLSCTDTINKAITIVSKLPGLFTVTDSISNCVPFTATFTNNSLPSSLTVWTFAPGVTDTGNVVTHTFTQVGTYNVKMVAKHPAGCAYEASKNIVVRGPSGTFQYDRGYICGNTPVRFSATVQNVDSIRWNFGDGTFLTSTSAVVYHTYTLAGNYVPSAALYAANNASCNLALQGIDTIKVDYVKTGFRYTEQKYCDSTKVQFTDTSRSYFTATSWKWSFGDGTFSNDRNPAHTYTSTNTWQVQLIVTSASGCADTLVKQIYIKVNSKPVANINAAVTACTSRPVSYQAQVFSADSITVVSWSFSNGYNTTGLQVNNIYVNAGTYTATLVTGTLYGCQDTARKTITINPSPNIIASADITICKGQSTQLSVTGTTSYNWSPLNGTLSCTTCTNPIANPLTTTQYVVMGTNSFGCTAFDTVVVTVAQPIDITASANDTICIGQSSQLNVTGATTYLWSPATTLSSATSATPVAIPTLTTQYRVIGFDSYNCFQDTAYVVVAVGQYPTVSLGADKILPTGTPLPLTTVVTNGPITKWLWGPSAATLSCTTCPLPTATIKREICYTVEATNLYKCAARDTMCVKVFCEGTQVFIPNAFTPDGDGVNDVLMVRAQGIRTVKNFRIFNRWGQVVFERNNFAPNDVAAGWDGTIGGKPASPDVYVYTCEVVCENDISYTYKGNVSIVK